jgi:hypothetical protein
MRALASLALALLLCCGGSPPGPRPPAPEGFTVQPQQGAVLLQWTGVPEATSYDVYAAIAPAPAANGRARRVAATGSTAYTFVLSGLASGVAYHFGVAAENANGQGPLSAEVAATVLVASGAGRLPRER